MLQAKIGVSEGVELLIEDIRYLCSWVFILHQLIIGIFGRHSAIEPIFEWMVWQILMTNGGFGLADIIKFLELGIKSVLMRKFRCGPCVISFCASIKFKAWSIRQAWVEISGAKYRSLQNDFG